MYGVMGMGNLHSAKGMDIGVTLKDTTACIIVKIIQIRRHVTPRTPPVMRLFCLCQM